MPQTLKRQLALMLSWWTINMYQQDKIETKTLTISSGESVSDALDLRGKTLIGLIMPSALTSTSMNFELSVDNDSFSDMYDTDGNKIAITVASSRFISIDGTDFYSARYLKLSGFFLYLPF